MKDISGPHLTSGDQEICAARLRLREYQHEDWVSAHLYGSDPEVVRYQTWGPNSEEQTREFIGLTQIWRHDIPRIVYEFAVTLKESRDHIGGCGLRIKNIMNLEADLGYTLHRNFWGKGYGTETAQALLKFGFETLGLHRIWASCDPENNASKNVLQKIGMKEEGKLRKNTRVQGQWRDSLLFAKLDSD